VIPHGTTAALDEAHTSRRAAWHERAAKYRNIRIDAVSDGGCRAAIVGSSKPRNVDSALAVLLLVVASRRLRRKRPSLEGARF